MDRGERNCPTEIIKRELAQLALRGFRLRPVFPSDFQYAIALLRAMFVRGPWQDLSLKNCDAEIALTASIFIAN